MVVDVDNSLRRLFGALTSGQSDGFSWYGYISRRDGQYAGALTGSFVCKWRRDDAMAEIVALLDGGIVYIWIWICCARHWKETVAGSKFWKVTLVAVLEV